MSKNIYLVIGSTGLAGCSLTKKLANEKDSLVLAMARSIEADSFSEENIKPIKADLLSIEDVRKAVGEYKVTHLVYAAHYPGDMSFKGFEPKTHCHAKCLIAMQEVLKRCAGIFGKLMGNMYYDALNDVGHIAEIDINLSMFENALSVSKLQGTLKHVTLITGGRCYGHHMGHWWAGYNPNFTEDMPRSPGKNWYFSVEDALTKSANNEDWSWNILRPSMIAGTADNSAFGFSTTLAVYAALLQEEGRPLIFPGKIDQLDSKQTFSHANEISNLAEWCINNDQAHNEAYNAAPGEVATWRELWEALGAHFGMKCEYPGQLLPEAVFADADKTWNTIVDKHGLTENKLEDVADFFSMLQFLMITWDNIYSQEKVISKGYDGSYSSTSSLIEAVKDLETRNMIPTQIH